MAWYKAGTVTVTNGSATVTGAGGTSFVSNVVVGDAFQAPDGRSYEIAAVVSASELTLGRAYMGATASGQTYTIQPTSSFASDLATRVVQLIGSFGAVRDGIGQGLIADGSAIAPGLRFASDQDTGVRKAGADALSLVTGGADRAIVTANGNLLVGRSFELDPAFRIHAERQGASATYLTAGNATNGAMLGVDAAGTAEVLTYLSSYPIRFGSYGGGSAKAEWGRFDANGLFLVGTGTGACHTFYRGTTQGTRVLEAFGGAAFFAGGGGVGSSAATSAIFTFNTSTGRSINAGGTINASGADYAEYMTKAAGCGTIAAGDVCGVNRDGRLTRSWADAVSFVVKSSDPAYVGGDTWSAHLPPCPEKPAEPPAPAAPPELGEEASDAEEAAWVEAMRSHQIAQAVYTRDHAAWEVANAAYDHDLAAWEAALEEARVTVDRIAFAGQVPVNIEGPFDVGDYLIAAANGGGIRAVAVAEADITFEQYRRRLGKVWAIRDGRPWIDVQHG
jgi:hypothetical protein